jgi:D-beta-D-heptose 7-phosphate kinase/D-beta-D-heptose 1-phosphate adenosyltransferase
MIIDIRTKWDVFALKIVMSTLKVNRNQVVGLTSGCYDLFHNLHLTYLQRCRRMCDILIVGVDSDDLVKQAKGPERPVIPEHQRINLVSALKCVDIAFIMGTVEDFRQAVELFQPKFIFKNQNFRPQDVVGGEHSTVVTIPDVFQPDSTSGIIEEIKKARLKSGAPSGIAPAPSVSLPSATPASGGLPPGAARRSTIGKRRSSGR